jgi:uncharacterized protein YndB with AHSA1/START domain
MTTAAQTTETTDREINTIRLLDAPRELVWKVWTDPKHIANWFGPDGFSTTTETMDVRPGGTWRFTMHSPDGTAYANLITFEEVVRPERLAYLQGDDTEPDQFHTTVTLEKQGDKTLFTMRALFKTAAAREYVVREYAAIESREQTVARLAEYLQTLVA